MSMAREELADRVRDLLPREDMVREQKMFGAMAFMLNGHMVVATTKDGSLLVRVGKDGMEAALRLPGVGPMEMSGRRMGGFVVVDGDVIEEESALGEWLDKARMVVKSLPPK